MLVLSRKFRESVVLGGVGGIDRQFKVTVLEIARRALQLATPKLGTADQRRITAILESLGWTRGRRTGGGRPWVPPQPSNDA